MPIQDDAGVGEHDAFRPAHYQLLVEFGLQTRQMMAYCGLSNVQMVCRARKAAGLNDPNEIAELAQIHRSLPAFCNVARCGAGWPLSRRATPHSAL